LSKFLEKTLDTKPKLWQKPGFFFRPPTLTHLSTLLYLRIIMMRKLQLGLLLVSVAVLVIFIQQNLTPVLPLTFLGLKTVAFPLAVWILLALAAGGLTSWLILMLFKLQLSLNYGSTSGRNGRESTTGRSVQQTQAREFRTTRNREDPDNDPDNYSDSDPVRTTATYERSSTGRSPKRDEFEPVNDWQDDEENWVEGDFDSDPPLQKGGDRNWVDEDEENWVDEPIAPSAKTDKVDQGSPQKTDYEIPQEPVNKYQAGSIYSYSYRSSENTGVGKTESVNDAEYRVIVPPSAESEESSSSPLQDEPSQDYGEKEYSSEDYADKDYDQAEYSSSDDREDDYSSEKFDRDESADPSASPNPEPEPTSVYTTKVQSVRSTPTKIQTDDEDDWSQPTQNNNDDW
jgi:uncharacterized integral membrane protein